MNHVFTYKAMDAKGVEKSGRMTAGSQVEVTRKLLAQGLFPTAIVDLVGKRVPGMDQVDASMKRASDALDSNMRKLDETLKKLGESFDQGFTGTSYSESSPKPRRSVKITIRRGSAQGSAQDFSRGFAQGSSRDDQPADRSMDPVRKRFDSLVTFGMCAALCMAVLGIVMSLARGCGKKDESSRKTPPAQVQASSDEWGSRW